MACSSRRCLRCTALLLALLRAPAASGETRRVQFAFYENALYARVDQTDQDRALSTLMYLQSLLRRHAAAPGAEANATASAMSDDLDAVAAANVNASAVVPHGFAPRLARMPDAVHGTIAGCIGDSWISPPASELPNGSAVFSFWRPPEVQHNVSRLLPDHDFAGWANAWIPPLPMIARELAAEGVVHGWHARSPVLYWTGASLGANGVWRNSFRDAAARLPDLFEADMVLWRAERQGAALGPGEPPVVAPGEAPGGGGWLKPVRMDLRKLARYKYLIYLPGGTWSTSLKRIALAGGVLFMPRANPQESLASLLLRHACSDDIAYFDGPEPDAMLGSLEAQVRALRADDAAAQARATRFAACAQRVLSEQRTDAAALLALHEAAEEQQRQGAPPFPLEALNRTADVSASLAGGLMRRIGGCAELKARWTALVGPMYAWQVNAWYDDDCQMRAGSYLRFAAL